MDRGRFPLNQLPVGQKAYVKELTSRGAAEGGYSIWAIGGEIESLQGPSGDPLHI